MSIGEDELANLVADAIKVPRKDFSKHHLEALLVIGQGMFWSGEFDIRANDLADAIRAEFDRQKPSD